MKRIILTAPAKVNLTLDVVGTRPDGYHLVDTILQTVGLHDTLTFTRTDRPAEIHCSLPELEGEGNLAARAAQALCRAVARPYDGFTLEIEKVIPMQAGLGGGSADAAAALVGLNLLWELHLPLERLCAIGAEVGADVPFLVRGGTARARGIGEELEPLDPMPEVWLVIQKPPIGMETARAFKLYDACTPAVRPDTDRMVSAIAARDLRQVAEGLCNRMEIVCEGTEIPAIKRAMREAGALGCAMTGSGTAVFGLFPSKEAARSALERLDRGMGALYLTRTHPYGPTLLARQTG